MRARTGLELDATFPATKLGWVLDHVDGARTAAEAGRLAYGDVASWLLHRLGGVHVADAGNAGRSLLCGLGASDWDDDLLHLFDVPRALLPPIVDSDAIAAEIGGVPVRAAAGDQPASLFGLRCWAPGTAKATLGTGAFVLAHAGAEPPAPPDGILASLAWRRPGDDRATRWRASSRPRAPRSTGSRGSASCPPGPELDALLAERHARAWSASRRCRGSARRRWDAGARGALLGLSLGTTRADLARAVVDGILHQVADATEAMGVRRRCASTAASRARTASCSGSPTSPACASSAPRAPTPPRSAPPPLAGLAAGVWCRPERPARVPVDLSPSRGSRPPPGRPSASAGPALGLSRRAGRPAELLRRARLQAVTVVSGANPLARLRANVGLVVLFGCLISLITLGVRAGFGLFTDPLTEARGWDREVFALAIALQNLLWGLGQPLAGAVADRFGAGRVLAAGAVLYAAGTALMAVSAEPDRAVRCPAACCSGSAGGRVVHGRDRGLLPPRPAGPALGGDRARDRDGLAGPVPVRADRPGLRGGVRLADRARAAGRRSSRWSRPSPSRSAASRAEDDEDDEPRRFRRAALRQAFGHGSYLLLAGGFFVCGFHVAFITVHLPPYVADLGLSAGTAALAIGLVGLFNIVGSYSAGVLGTRHSPRLLLSGIYGARAVVITLFLLVPASAASVLVFAAAMGLLWLSTVPLTSALIAIFFGVRHMGTLFGFVFLSHQVGAFAGVWLGGAIESATGSYDAVWWISVALGLVAAALHLPIAERRAPALAPAPQAA